MITLLLERQKFLEHCTLGVLHTPKQKFYTLEDKVREFYGIPVSEWKVPGKTAIPQGTYPLILDMSNRFKKIMPHLLNVEGFDGVRIHSGNSEADTEGCILLGWNIGADGKTITQSRLAVEAFMDEMDGYYDANLPVEIQVVGI